jgi:hypothetical protein
MQRPKVGGDVVLMGGRMFISASWFIILTGSTAFWLFGPAGMVRIGASILIFGYLGFLIALELFEKSVLQVALMRLREPNLHLLSHMLCGRRKEHENQMRHTTVYHNTVATHCGFHWLVNWWTIKLSLQECSQFSQLILHRIHLFFTLCFIRSPF